jgi:hypothetical protein
VPTRRWIIAIFLLSLAACGDDGVSIRDDKLSTKERRTPRTFWGTSPVTADVQWQMQDFVVTDEGIRVSLDYDIIFINPSDTTITITVSRLTFEDRSFTQIATYEPEGGVVTGSVLPGAAVQFKSEAEIDVLSLFEANSIRSLVIWATFKAGTTGG